MFIFMSVAHGSLWLLQTRDLHTEREINYTAEEDGLKGLNGSGSSFTHVLISFMIAIMIINCKGRRRLRTRTWR